MPITRTLPSPNRVARIIAIYFGVDLSEVLWLREAGLGYGEIYRAYSLAALTGASVDDVLQARQSGLGWGEIEHELARPGHNGGLGQIVRRDAATPLPTRTSTVSLTPTPTRTPTPSPTPTRTGSLAGTITVTPTVQSTVTTLRTTSPAGGAGVDSRAFEFPPTQDRVKTGRQNQGSGNQPLDHGNAGKR